MACPHWVTRRKEADGIQGGNLQLSDGSIRQSKVLAEAVTSCRITIEGADSHLVTAHCVLGCAHFLEVFVHSPSAWPHMEDGLRGCWGCSAGTFFLLVQNKLFLCPQIHTHVPQHGMVLNQEKKTNANDGMGSWLGMHDTGPGWSFGRAPTHCNGSGRGHRAQAR